MNLSGKSRWSPDLIRFAAEFGQILSGLRGQRSDSSWESRPPGCVRHWEHSDN
jgi:hypothetical protein